MSHIKDNFEDRLHRALERAECVTHRSSEDWETGLGAYLLEKVEFSESGCWNWTGSMGSKDYGRLGIGCDRFLAHQLSLFEWVDEIKTDLEIDHLCGNHSCINPFHLEAVTHSENMKRNIGRVAKFRSTCRKGHEYTPDNTRYRHRNGLVMRVCAICTRNSINAHYARNKDRIQEQRREKKNGLPRS